MLRVRLILPTLATALALAGCGDGEAEGDYGSQLDTLCVELFDEVDALPGKVEAGELEVGEVEAVAEESQQRFVSEVAELDPPDELAGRHEDLLAALEGQDPGTDLETAKLTLTELVEIYADLGAAECEGRSARSLARFEAVPRPTP